MTGFLVCSGDTDSLLRRYTLPPEHAAPLTEVRAGFAGIEELDIEDDFFRFYLLPR